jgi:hypothetical protein
MWMEEVIDEDERLFRNLPGGATIDYEGASS